MGNDLLVYTLVFSLLDLLLRSTYHPWHCLGLLCPGPTVLCFMPEFSNRLGGNPSSVVHRLTCLMPRGDSLMPRGGEVIPLLLSRYETPKKKKKIFLSLSLWKQSTNRQIRYMHSASYLILLLIKCSFSIKE